MIILSTFTAAHLKLGVNVESDFDTRSAVDISGGLSVDTIRPSIRKPIDSYDISHVETMSDGDIIIAENYNVEDDPLNVAIYIPIKENITDLSGLIQTSKKIKGGNKSHQKNINCSES